MILVDTSVWVDHLVKGDPGLAELLGEGRVLTHPLVVEELACGRITKRAMILGLLRALPSAVAASHDEVMALVDLQRLHGKGLGAVDIHLLASARLSGARIWSRDKALLGGAKTLGLLA